MEWMMGNMSKYFKDRYLVLDTFHGTLATVNACLQLPEQFVFVRCEKGSACFYDAISSLVEIYARRVLSLNFVLAGSEEAVEAIKLFVKKMAGFASKKSVDSWAMTPELVPVQSFPMYIMQFSGYL